MNNALRYNYSIYFIFFCMALMSVGCKQSSPKAQHKGKKKTPLVTVQKARVMPLVETLDITGSVEPVRIAKMSSPIEGPVEACVVREGDRVHRNKLLVRIGRIKGDTAALVSAKAELEKEQAEIQRIERLVKSDALPGEELDKSKVRVQQAKARMIRANERLTDYRILAPWVGIVSQVHVRDGDFVFVRSPLVEIFDPGSLIVRFALPENHAIDIAVGTEIEITLDAYPKRTLSGKINRVYPDIDRQTRTRLAEAKIDQKLALLPGMFARIKVPLTRIADAVVVPKDAVIYSVGVKPALFVLKPNHTVERRTIELGIETDKFAHIRSGIKAGETVVISGYGRLRDGAKVRVSRTSHKKQRDTSHKKQRDTSHKK